MNKIKVTRKKNKMNNNKKFYLKKKVYNLKINKVYKKLKLMKIYQLKIFILILRINNNKIIKTLITNLIK